MGPAALPGILTVACVGLVTNVLKLTELQIFFLGSVFSIPLMLLIGAALYLLLAAARGFARIVNYLTTLTLPVLSVGERSFWITAYCLAIFLSPVIGTNIAVLLERDDLHRAASSMAIVGRLDAGSIWSPLERLRYASSNALIGEPDGLDSRPPIPGRKWSSWTGDVYFEVHMKDKSVFVGWPRAYGPRGSESEIYLSPACEVHEKQPLTAVAGPGVVIKEREIAFIALVDRKDRTTGKDHECFTLTRN